jgi:hypothetical protein
MLVGMVQESLNELVMMVEPPSRDVDTPGDPYISGLECVVKELSDTRRSRGLASEPWMKPDRHHARVATEAFTAELVEAALTCINKIGRARVSLRKDVPRIVIRSRVWNYEMRPIVDVHKVRQVVVIGIRVIDEATFFD